MATFQGNDPAKQVRISESTYTKVREEAEKDLRTLRDEFTVLIDEAVEARREARRSRGDH